MSRLEPYFSIEKLDGSWFNGCYNHRLHVVDVLPKTVRDNVVDHACVCVTLHFWRCEWYPFYFSQVQYDFIKKTLHEHWNSATNFLFVLVRYIWLNCGIL